MVQRWPWSAHLEMHRQKMAAPANAALYPARSRIVEPVFGWIKQAWQFRRWTFHGLRQVRAQWQLICTAANLRVLLKAWRMQLQIKTA